MNAPDSLTGAYISGRAHIDMLPERRSPNGAGDHHPGRARKTI